MNTFVNALILNYPKIVIVYKHNSNKPTEKKNVLLN